MKSGFLLQLILATAIVSSFLPPVASIYEETIKNFLNEFRMRMCHPIPNLGLPALDPLQLSHAETSVNNQYLIE